MPMQATTTSPLFSAALKPDRSPRIVGGWVALAVAALLTTPFALVVPEMLLPAGTAFVIGAFWLTLISLQQSRRRRLAQHVTLWADQLEISTSDGTGTRTLRRFNPRTVRLILQRDDNERALALRLRDGKDEIEIGSFLRAEDKSSFAKAFGTALRKARLDA